MAQSTKNCRENQMDDHRIFWLEHPALGFGVSALLGAFIFFESAYFIAALWVIYLIYLFRLQSFQHIVVISMIAAYSYFLFSNPPSSSEGQAVFSIHNVQPYSSPFQNGWRYQGHLLAFESNGKKQLLHLPCSTIYMGDKGHRPLANADYVIEGHLKKSGAFEYSFKVKSWECIPPDFCQKLNSLRLDWRN